MVDRTLFTERLHFIADYVSALPPELPTPRVNGSASVIEFNVWWPDDLDATTSETVLRYAKAIGGRFEKNDPSASTYTQDYYVLSRRVSNPELDVSVQITCFRDAVCTPVVVGTKVVEHPARPATEAYVEEVPVIEYECKPLNAVIAS